MGKKGSKRKTRWRTLSIGAPPGEEDEEEGLRKDYAKSQDKDANNAHTFDRNGQAGYKPRRTGTGTSGSSTSGYASSVSRSHRDESTGSPSQPKVIFNEDEYTRITTPRQDVLFKKGYLSRKKPWTGGGGGGGGNASTSATPSTADSQSASHSTADGSETTEDQQLLDRDSGTGEYPPMVEPGAQLGYGTYYDHASGYYYEYPVMLVGPTPVPAQVGPSVLAAVPCGPVPLRPIEWINPAFVPKLANQPYCLMDYQTSQNTETSAIVEEQNGTMMLAEASNGAWNESGTGSASCSGSVAEEMEEQAEEADNGTAEQRAKEQFGEEQQQYPEQQQQQQQQHHHHHLEEQRLENGVPTTLDPYLDPLLMQEPPAVHMSHVVQAAPQPYMYPGHYMFGLPLVDVNGVTIQSGPLVRTMDVTAMTMACAKRRKKRKKRKQKRPTLGNTEDEEEGEYSSECDNDISSSRLPWSECPATATTTTTTTVTNRPLNPECQEFQLRPTLQSRILSSPVSTSNVAEEITSANNAPDVSVCVVETEFDAGRETGEKKVDNTPIVQSPTNREDASTTSHNVSEQVTSENVYQSTSSVGRKPRSKKAEVNGRANHPVENTETMVTNETVAVTRSYTPIDHEAASNGTNTAENGDDTISANTKCELLQSNGNDVNTELLNNHVECTKQDLTNGGTHLEDLNELTEQANVPAPKSINPPTDIALIEKSRSPSAASNVNLTNANAEEDNQRLRRCNNSSVVRTTSSLVQTRKYNKKGTKFVREPTPGPDLDDQATRSDVENGKVIRRFEVIELSDDTCAVHADHECPVANDKLDQSDRKVPCEEYSVFKIRDNDDNKTKTITSQGTIEGGSTNEDSGFESQSQTRLSEYPITNAVTEWLHRANSPDMFLTSASISNSDTDEEDDEDMDAKPPKNLQGNPMPALSANSSVDNDATTVLSRTASCGEFAKTNNNNNNYYYSNIEIIDRVEAIDVSAVGRRKREAIGTTRRKAATRRIDKRNNRSVDDKTQSQLVTSLITCHRLENLVTAVRLRNPPKGDVGNVCEFTQKDSVAGMRVALSSRINANGVSARRAKTLRRINRDPAENIDIRMRRIENAKDGGENGTESCDTVRNRIEDSTVSVRTFEKGEIIVSEDGKLLPTSSYEPVPSHSRDISKMMRDAAHKIDVINRNVEAREEGARNSSENDDNVMTSSVSIEEPDVLECWEAETIEPVITPKRMLQSSGVLCEGEAVEEDNFEIEKATVEHVQKYYRLARDSAISIEEESSELSVSSSVSVPRSRTVPNNSKKMIDGFCIEEIPIVVPDKSRDIILGYEKIPIDEAFEAYESCYNGKSPFLASFDSKMFKQQRPLYGQNGEGPIPCRAVCCNIQ